MSLLPWTCQLCCCLCRVRKLSDFVNNIFICVLKMNEGLIGLERHEGEKLMTGFSFLGELTLAHSHQDKCVWYENSVRYTFKFEWTSFILSFQTYTNIHMQSMQQIITLFPIALQRKWVNQWELRFWSHATAVTYNVFLRFCNLVWILIIWFIRKCNIFSENKQIVWFNHQFALFNQ